MPNDPNDSQAQIIELKTPEKGPITPFSPELESFTYELTRKGYAETTIRVYVTAVSAVLEHVGRSDVPEQRLYEGLHMLPSSRRSAAESGWRLLCDWLVPRGYRMTPLPKRVVGRPARPVWASEEFKAEEARKQLLRVKQPARSGFRGFGDLWGYREHLEQQGYNGVTAQLYFQIVSEALHHLEGDAACSSITIRAVLEKAAKRYPYLNPTSVRFLRAWAHLEAFWQPKGWEVTVWERPPVYVPRRGSELEASEKTQPDAEVAPELAQGSIQNTTSSVSECVEEDF